MFAVNKDYNSYFKVVKPEVELSFEGYEDASKVAGILMKQGYVVTMYRDDPGMDVYCLYATYVGDNGYDFERMAAFIDTSTEMAGLRQHDDHDVFPDDAKQLEDEDDSDSDNNPEKWDDADEDGDDIDFDYYGLGYSDGEFDRNNGNNYDNSRYDDNEYSRGYEDGWDDTENALAAELGADDEDELSKDEGEGSKNKDSLDYDVGYSDGQYDYYHYNNYNDGRCESDEYVCGYADGWDAAADEDKPPVYDFDDDDVEETDGWMRIN